MNGFMIGKRPSATSLIILLITLQFLLSPPASVWAAAGTTADAASYESQDKEQCTRNLKLIFDALQAYQVDHKELPHWLSDLVPQYVNDANVFICPVCKRTGQTEDSPLADPKLASSYIYLFSPAPLDTKFSYKGDFKTHRELSAGLQKNLGTIVPIVRCLHHRIKLELSLEGSVNESTLMLESTLMFKPKPVEPAEAPANAHTKTNLPEKAASKAAKSAAMTIPKRDPQATPSQIDLGNFFNASLNQSWLGGTGDDLSTLPAGLQKFQGVTYEIRGVIQLAGSAEFTKRFPTQIKSIPVHQKCERLHFLHATANGGIDDNGHQVATYIIHLATNDMQMEIPIHYGQDVRNWHMKVDTKAKISKSSEAWIGTNPACDAAGKKVRILSTTWENVASGVEIESIDYVSTLNAPAPFLIAITAE
jgi:hypothetical protein